jgi:transposase
MLKSSYYIEPSEVDRLIFEKLVPNDHLLRRVKEAIDFEPLREKVKACYSAEMGRGAEDPVRMIKLEFLQFYYGLSDREVLKQLQVNVAYRYFLDLSIDSQLPTSGLLSQFRQRLGEKRHEALFHEVVSQARQKGLVKDRLRLKDATHVIANIAVPSAIRLVAQVRQRLLKSVKPYAAKQVEAEEQRAEQIRQLSDDLSGDERLLMRVQHLRTVVAWADELQAKLGIPPQEPSVPRQHFDAALELAHRILEQNDDPEKPDQTLSSSDPDARTGKHGTYYDGYQLDISMDADSEIITALVTPPANHDEAAHAAVLIQKEEQMQANQVLALSMDAIGFRGDVLRTLKDPHGLGLDVYVPPQKWSSYAEPYFNPSHFRLKDEGRLLICPAEEETRKRYRNAKNTGWKFLFERSRCLACPLLEKCLPTLPLASGRTVIKNDYEAEYRAAREVSQTETYTQVRQQHPKVERKLAEIIRYHNGRRTRYRGNGRVAIQYLMTALVVNVKRIVRLLYPQPTVGFCQAAVNA